MPIIGIMIGGLNFSSLVIRVGNATIRYGAFLQNVIDLLIVAACIFIFIKILSKLSKKKEQEEAIQKDEQIKLLEEIRDLLEEKKS